MKKITFILFILFFVSDIFAQQCGLYVDTAFIDNALYPHSYRCELVFIDNFDSIALDTSINGWDYRKSDISYNKPLIEGNCDGNVSVCNGWLRLVAERKDTVLHYNFINSSGGYNDTIGRFYYTVSSIYSKKKFPIEGKFEARIKIPEEVKLWPAFWLYGEDDISYNEIDVFEYDITNLTCDSHYKYKLNAGDTVNSCMKLIKRGNEAMNFVKDTHIFSVLWTKQKIEWYIDSTLIRTLYRFADIKDMTDIGTYQQIIYYNPQDTISHEAKYFPQDSMNVCLNVALASPIKKNIENLYNIRDTMFVDYVKVYRLVPCYEDVTINNDGYCYSNLGRDNDTIIRGDNVFVRCNEINVADGNNVEIHASSDVYFMLISCPKMINIPPTVEYEKDLIITTGDGSEFIIDIEPCSDTVNNN